MDTSVSIHSVPAAWLHDSDLAEHAPTYWRRLVDQGYAANTVRVYTCCVAHFARWKRQRRCTHQRYAADDIGRFLDKHLPRCTCPSPVRRSRHENHAALRHLYALLREVGSLSTNRSIDPIDQELRGFDKYMRDARGLAVNTRTQRVHILRHFLEQRVSHGHSQLGPHDLRLFINKKLQRWSPASGHVLVGALRSYLRYRATCGDSVAHLLPVIVSPANWRLAALPQTLTRAEVADLLKAFAPTVPSVRRAYAMVRCVVDLGLRASEVVGITLDDIDWLAGTVRIGHNKSLRVDVLPLPRSTGDAIAQYLRFERPPCVIRQVFVRHVAPIERPIGPGVVRRAMHEAFRRSGQTHTRVHILRHTLAERLLEGGGTLKEVADLLRHRELDTTLIYAKVDTNRLAGVALPWPGSVA